MQAITLDGGGGYVSTAQPYDGGLATYVAPVSAPLYSAPTYYTAAPTYAPAYVTPAPAAPSPFGQAGPYGEGVFTPLDYPAMRFLGEAERLPSVQAQQQAAPNNLLLLGLTLGLALLFLKS